MAKQNLIHKKVEKKDLPPSPPRYDIDHSFNRTKIVATVGPASNTYDKLLKLVRAGVNVFRLNFSHGHHEDKKIVIDYIRKINREEKTHVAILGDLQGPKLRIGDIENNTVQLSAGDILTFTNKKILGTKEKVYLHYPNFHKDVKVGNKIMIDDGKIEVIVKQILPNHDVKVEVLIGGLLSSKKGVNLPDTHISLPALTSKDFRDLDFIMKEQLGWVALSFVRQVEDIKKLRRILDKNKSKTKIIAKIEMPEAIPNIREIINVSDGIMIARGDLGVELPVEKVPLLQKNIIRKCIHRAKPVIVATQMMESMIDRTKPNRSEITDVANAVLEGADAVMLSGETAAGHHPTLVVQTMRKIILEIEKTEYRYDLNDELVPQPHSPTMPSDAICYNACKLAKDTEAQALVGMTQSGYTAVMLSSYRPKVPLYVFTQESNLIDQLSLVWGVRTFFYRDAADLDTITDDQIHILKKNNFVKKGDLVVSTGSTPVHLQLPTNTIKISVVK